jgi:CDP-diacylglycerol--glycerol-3-phosphate 3-phosphatidyltransferase/cardiolipin synthase
MTWATRITIFRILLIPIFVGLVIYYGQSEREGGPDERLRYAAIAVFLIAAISDAVDGYLARHCNQRSRLGSILDPVADKLLMLSALIVLSVVPFGNLPSFPLWFPILIISRDAILLGGVLVLHFMTRHVEVKPHWTGKAATFFQLAAITCVLLKKEWMLQMCYAAGLLTVTATVIYLRNGFSQSRLHGLSQSLK